MIRTPRKFLIAVATLLAASQTAAAQDPEPPKGIELAAKYQTRQQPLLAVRPFSASSALAGEAQTIAGIIERDLDFSDRFRIFPTPASLATGEVDYRAWNSAGVVYVLTGEVTRGADGRTELRVTAHDVVYGQAKPTLGYALPPADDPGYRMAVHAIADELTQQITAQPGMAASRILFVRTNPDGHELMMIDSDGENIRRIGSTEGLIYSPVWSPDGARVAYVLKEEGSATLRERDMRTGSARTIATPRTNLLMTPSYSPDGRRIVYAANIGERMELFETDLGSGRFQQLTRGPRDSFSPTFSSDGSRIVFNSNRLGNPHIYLMPADGGAANLLTPYVVGQRGYYTSPEWAPTGTQVAFHGHWNARGAYQIFVADANRPLAQIRQLTTSGNNEDPSWAPDGRHIVYTASGGGQEGLYVVDVVTGRVRGLTRDARHRLADWSASLGRIGGPPGGP